LDKIFFRNS